jgi:hypothetical protein
MNRSSKEIPSNPGSASDLWRLTLARIPTGFGRLVHVASLRTPDGAYDHGGLARMVGGEEASQMVRSSHLRVFQEWLTLSLEQQKQDLQDYLSELPGGRAAVLGRWLGLPAYRELLPAAAQEVERELYVSDLETLLVLLRHEYGVTAPESKP